MGKRFAVIGVALGWVLLPTFAFGGLFPDEAVGGVEWAVESPQIGEKKITKKIIISKDQAIVDGDTIDLDDLEESLRRIGELDITIVGDIDEWEEEGIAKKRGEVVKFGGDVRIEENEKVAGSVVVFGGSATIAGTVTEDAVVFGGDLIIEETADIRGSAVCFGGEIIKAPGAKIGEQEVSLGGEFPLDITIGPLVGFPGFGRFIDRGVGVFAGIVGIGLVLLLGAGAIFFFPNALDRISGVIGINLLKTGLIGLLGEIMVLPVFVIVTIILCVSIIGIPLLFLVIPLGLLAVVTACFLGYIGAGLFVGRKIGERASLHPASTYKVMGIGVIALLAFDILSGIVGFTGDVLWPVQAFLGIVGCLVTYLAVTAGFGAVILTRFGTRKYAEEREGKAEG